MSAHIDSNAGANEAGEGLLDLVLAATLEGIVDHDLLAGTTSYSPRWGLLLGYDAEANLPQTPSLWLDLTHEMDRAEVQELWEAHVQSGWPFQHTWRMRHGHGGYRWIRCRSALRLTDQGVPARAISLFADVTEEVGENQRHRALVEAIPDSLLRIAVSGELLDVRVGANSNETALFSGLVVGELFDTLDDSKLADCLRELLSAALETGTTQQRDWSCAVEQMTCDLELRVTPSGSDEVVLLVRDVTETRRLERQLQQAQKLESIGQLAAGIAHEINTPTQFVGDNTRFVKGAFDDLSGALRVLGEALKEGPESADAATVLQALRAACSGIDLEFVLEEVPKAIIDCLSGLERVSSIVGAMKEFSHPGGIGRTAVDINQALRSTVTVARNEWKYVAEVEFDFEQDLPPVSCLAGEVNQVFLNVIVNGAHAIAKAQEDGRDCKGRILLRTRSEDGGVVVSISDSGCGIPEEIRS
ncbi:MAG TPA: PAS domain-containing protein, partial [Planctomycetota bacterium]|nr:PAS domain-containing protein [Planctomycetota bacterium]